MSALDKAELAIRQKLKDDFVHYASRCLHLRTKAGEIVPFVLNEAQLYIHSQIEKQRAEMGKVRAIILKGRQQGCSTYVEGRLYWRDTHGRGLRAFILTHSDDATNNIFEIAQRFHENCPPMVRPVTKAANAKELNFGDLDSGYKVGTAGSKAAGRGSTIQLFHGCLGLNVDVVLPNGKLTKVSQVSVGDTLVTHTGQEAQVSYISCQKKKVFSVKAKGLRDFPLVATGDHRFWTRDGWKELSNISVGDEIGYPIRRINGSITESSFGVAPAIRKQGGGRKEITVPNSVKFTYELGRVVGLFLAEGSITRQSKCPHAPNSVTFAVHEREVMRTVEWLSALKNLFGKMRVYAHKNSKTVAVTVSGKSFSTFLNDHVGCKDDKTFPRNWWNLPREYIEGIVHGYLSGDGHSSKRKNDRRISATSVRSAITIGLRDALASLGYGWATISYKSAAIRHGRNEREAWVLRLCGSGVDRLVSKLEWSMPARMRSGNYGEIQISDGYAWIPVVAIEDAGVQEVRDFEIDHVDHSYCVIHGGSHNSEVAFWPNAQEHAAGILQAIPDEPGTEIFLESTANGVGNYFHKLWQAAEAGESEFVAIFVPWYWTAEYRIETGEDFIPTEEENDYQAAYGLDLEQIAWRRKKITELGDATLFKQEYPATAAEAFQVTGADPFIAPEIVMKARKAKGVTAYGPTVLGVDPARFGDDRTAICCRQGRLVHWIRTFSKLDTMQVVGRVIKAIEEMNPDRVFIDTVGLGAGVYDRLMELYPKELIVAVAGSNTAMNEQRYFNRRSELWGNLKEWLTSPAQVSIPDSDELHADVTQIKYGYDSNGRLKMERKEDMKKRGIRSTDMADAIAYTLALPVKPKPKEEKIIDFEPYDDEFGY